VILKASKFGRLFYFQIDQRQNDLIVLPIIVLLAKKTSGLSPGPRAGLVIFSAPAFAGVRNVAILDFILG
jgi:hypothetical protein